MFQRLSEVTGLHAKQLSHFAQSFPAFKAATEGGDARMGLLPVGMTSH